MESKLAPYLQIFRSRRMAVVTILGFSSGLPLALTGGTLQAWMAVENVDLRTIGIFSLVALPYVLKFAWSPVMDRFVPPFLGRRRGWMLITQSALLVAIAALAFQSPREGPWMMAAIALTVAFLSASQDIVIDAYRTDILSARERGAGTAVSVTGYRIAMLVSGAIALILSEVIGWRNTYLFLAFLMLAGMAGTFIGREPAGEESPPRTLQEALWGPLRDYFSRSGAISVLILIILYKLGDAYAGTLTTAFLIKGMGFSAGEVGTINKGLGLVSLIIGALFGGALMVKLGLYRSLLYFGILQGISNLSFSLLAFAGKSYAVMIFAVAFENLTGGMGTSAFVALLMSLCSKRFSATQFALLSSLASIGRVMIAPTSGFVVEAIGWGIFFVLTTVTALPGIVMIYVLKSTITNIRDEGKPEPAV